MAVQDSIITITPGNTSAANDIVEWRETEFVGRPTDDKDSEEYEEALQRKRRNRILAIFAAGLLVVGVAIGVIIASSGGGEGASVASGLDTSTPVATTLAPAEVTVGGTAPGAGPDLISMTPFPTNATAPEATNATTPVPTTASTGKLESEDVTPAPTTTEAPTPARPRPPHLRQHPPRRLRRPKPRRPRRSPPASTASRTAATSRWTCGGVRSRTRTTTRSLLRGAGQDATLFEGKLAGGKVWYDISTIPDDCGASWDFCTGKGKGFNVGMTVEVVNPSGGPSCKNLSCMYKGCADAYQVPNDKQTWVCSASSSYIITIFC
ncbi:hypothetical protein SPRG_12245 [Saprolegnia parasitica CBS 223.65]|uniref:Uncharacterized protein n=1 Tax=Saprolegnia parasitica (strain CBS 223.65) TaxID=695850 RepID=A0A067C651_SAPPC|nr:hypothetical protein SPRG_12245 [Saprolegnia parasitica CBS 223.65]KDO22036.1 hypothetical protein SPRG_12245 [Saprolegnia parasitica CBS 223.65]|eukprot:XP_012207279.1 hypothetical protein SPRG_12245 [Saprolegnia parasitica CBS 223.65]